MTTSPVWLITGCSTGIGREIAIAALEKGHRAVVTARKPSAVEDIQAQFPDRAVVAALDVTDRGQIAAAIETAHKAFGQIDVLCNNAGYGYMAAIEEGEEDEVRAMFEANFWGPLHLIRAVLPEMRARKSGHIINISSIGVQTNPPRFSAYVASKAALDAFSRVIASEVIDDKVHITTINMPLVRTPMIAPTRMYDMFPAITPEEAAELIAKAMVGRPKKVATKLGNFGELLYAVAPKASDSILNTAYKLFPDSQAAKGKGEEARDKAPSTEAVAFAHLMKGVHW